MPLNAGNVRDVLMACVIVASLYGLIRVPRYHHEVQSRAEIRINLGEKTRSWRRSASSQASMEVQQDSAIFAHVKFRSERRHW
jgi:hypothetical protein